MNSLLELPESDFDLVLRYIDDDLEELEAVQFDLRLSNEPALVRALEQLQRMESLGRRSIPTEGVSSSHELQAPGPSSSDRAWLRMALVAATLLAVSLAAVRLRGKGAADETTPMRIALLAGADTAARYWDERGLDLSYAPSSARGDGRSQRSPKEIEEYALNAEREIIASALDNASPHSLTALHAPLFRVAFRPPFDCSVITVGVPSIGAPTRIYPDESEGDFSPHRLLGGRDYVLPRPSYALRTGKDGQVRDYHRGFIRKRSVSRYAVIHAYRAEPFDEALLLGLDRVLESLTASPQPSIDEQVQQIEAWFTERSFASQRGDVIGE